jgi:hypothetical protein
VVQRAALLAFVAALLWPAGSARAYTVEPGIVSTGDGDLYAEPNEEIHLRPRLHNDGYYSEKLTNIRGTVASSASMSVISGALTWPDLLPWKSAPATNDLVIASYSRYAFECGADLGLQMELATDQGPRWTQIRIPTGEPGGTCRNDRPVPPTFTLRLYQRPAYIGNWNQVGFWDARDPDGWITSVRVTVDGRDVQYQGEPTGAYEFQWTTLGRRVVKVAMTDNDGATTTKTLNVDVVPKQLPRQPKRYTTGPRFALFVPRYLPTADANELGVPVNIECKRTCAAMAELQLTRYRARKLGLRAPRRGKLTIASEVVIWSNYEHHFLLRPNARVRRALRRARKVPVLVRATSLGTSYNNYGLTRTTQAEIELTGPRRKRR